MPDFQAYFSSINPFKDLIVPAIAAVFGLWFATRKFRKERLWQEKYLAYQRVLESIEAIRYWADETTSDVSMLPTVGWFDGKSSNDFYAVAKREVAKQTLIGTLLLSEEFVSDLTDLYIEIFRETHQASEEFHEDEQDGEVAFGAHASEIRKIADKYLPKLISLARNDLGA